MCFQTSQTLISLTLIELQDMASDERKRANDAINMQNLHNAQGADDPEAETDAFQCGRCKQAKAFSSSVSCLYSYLLFIEKDKISPGPNKVRRRAYDGAWPPDVLSLDISI